MTRKKPSRKRKVKPRRRSLFRVLLRWLFAAAIWGFLALAVFVGWTALELPDLDELVDSRAPFVTVLASDGEVLSTYGDVHGRALHFSELPQELVLAAIAIEDRRFFDHFGIDVFGILRAGISNFRSGRIVQGGSTITQQIAKNLFLTPERSYKRKFQEMLLSFWLEQKFSKTELLAIYLNRIYLGAGMFGVDAAARRFFDKSARDLSLAEAAMIAGLFKAPSRYNPITNPESAQQRAAVVLDAMVQAEFIDSATAHHVQQSPASAHGNRSTGKDVRYATDWVMTQSADHVGVPQTDIVVVTTINPAIQRLAQNTLREAIEVHGTELNANQGALVTLAPDGRILAMVGGADYGATQFNRATNALRQPGSVFKLFVYLAALEAGFRPDDIVIDRPVTIRNWSPRNFNERHEGRISLQQAFARSINTVAADVAWRTGIPRVAEVAKRLGVDGDIPVVPSIALGTRDMTLLDLSAAYAVVANQGLAVWPYVIQEIRSADGDVLYRHEPVATPRLLDPPVHADMINLLQTVISDGTGRNAAIAWPAGGKTGTSQDFRDAWFIGFTRQFTTGVWIGNDDGSSMNEVTGGRLPAQIWAQYMNGIMAGREALPLVDPVERVIDATQPRNATTNVPDR